MVEKARGERLRDSCLICCRGNMLPQNEVDKLIPAQVSARAKTSDSSKVTAGI